MPQTYLHGGDTLFYLGAGDKIGQTFRPQSDFLVEWVDLEMRGALTSIYPFCEIYWADAHHEPSGDYLTYNRGTLWMKLPILRTRRIRIPMTPYLLKKDWYYVIILEKRGGLLMDHPWVQYDAGDAAYPRGLRISSDDGGLTWTKHFNDDLVFGVFGTPPVPPPPPEPPIPNWAILDIQQIVTLTGYKIVVITNVPCHLYMEWTNHEPLKHDRTIISRGLTVPAATQYCFVDWHENEQEELGDTIIHTFVKEPWPHCETRWFTFRGKVDNEWCPSVGPIFKKHRTTPTELTTIFYPHIWPLTDSCDGRTRRGHIEDLPWDDVHDGAGTWAQSSAETAYADIHAERAEDMWEWIHRSFILFNTDEIPAGSTITSATLHLQIVGTLNTLHPSASINVFESWPASDGEIVAADYQRLGSTPLSSPIRIDSMNDLEWITFTLNATGRSKVIPNGVTKLAIREATFDAPNNEPDWVRLGRAFAQWESADGLYNIPYLEVTYDLP